MPFRMSIAGDTFYYIPPGEAILAYFKNSRDLSGKALSLIGLQYQFGCPKDDLKLIDGDNSGLNLKPAPGYESFDPGRRVFYMQHRDFHTLLAGSSLDAMTDTFVGMFTQQLRESTAARSEGWTKLPDLYLFLRSEMFRASTQALCGDHFFQVCPNFDEEFWAFDSGMKEYLQRVPRWLTPGSYAKRDRAQASVLKWHRFLAAHSDRRDEGPPESEWDSVWGTRLMRARDRMFKKLGTSPNGNASMDLGMLWA